MEHATVSVGRPNLVGLAAITSTGSASGSSTALAVCGTQIVSTGTAPVSDTAPAVEMAQIASGRSRPRVAPRPRVSDELPLQQLGRMVDRRGSPLWVLTPISLVLGEVDDGSTTNQALPFMNGYRA
jgi:hypothetical protein